MIAAGTTLQGRYIIERIIGQGGMGAVYLARQLALNERPVAIKHMSMPRGQAADQARAAAQFQHEAATLATLRHPNLVSVHDFFSEGSEYYLVMEYVEGSTLDVVLEKAGGPLEVGRVTGWGQELCGVLRYLHEQHPPIVFRDLKPSNIMLDALGHLRLIDFGIAKSFQLQSATSTFIIGAGTPGYAAPEQYGTAAVDARTDIYALGAVLYTLLTGQAPCDAIDRVLGRAALVPASSLNPQVPAGLDAVVDRMMALQPEQRQASADDAAEALRAVEAAAGRVPSRTSGGVRAPEVAPAAPPEAAPSWLAVVLVLLLLAGLGGVVMWQEDARARSELERRVQEGATPALTAVPSPPPAEAVAPSAAPTASPSARAAMSAAPSATPTGAPSASASAMPASAAPSAAPSASASADVAAVPVASPSAAAHASPSPSPPPSASPSAEPVRPTSNANIVTTGSGLMYQDIKQGDGPVPRAGETVEVQYTAWLNSGAKIDSSADRGRPFRFVLGRGQVIKGWDEGIASMHVGGKRTLFIPPNLAYGQVGAPPAIPPNATLILDVEIVGVEPQP